MNDSASSITAVRLRSVGSLLAASAGLIVLALLVYAPALRGAMLWDDPAHVTRLGLQGWHGLWRIWFEIGATQEYYPVLHTAFWIEHALWGESMLAYHLLNVLLHAGNAVLLALCLRRLWSDSAAAWLAATLFVVHPVCVESVAWITEQKNTLSALFYLLSALGYLEFQQRRRGRAYAWAFGCFLLALGAKTMTVTLPAALLVLSWWQHGRLAWRRDVLPLLPWLAVALAAGLLTRAVEGEWVGANLVVPDLSLLQRTLLAARVLWFSVGQLLWPAGLTFFYPLWDVAAESRGWIVHLLAAVAVTAALWLCRRRARGPLAWWLLYAGTLFPVLGFLKVFSFSFSYVADHFQYLAIPIAMAGVAAAGVAVMRQVAARPRALAPTLAASVVLTLGLLARNQSRLYQDNETLFRANIAHNPRSWMGHHILADTVARTPGRRVEAIALFQRALELKPDNPDSLAALAALLVRAPGHRDEAIALFRRALQLRPTFAEAHNGLANELAATPEGLAEAVEHYETALRLRPKFALARANLAQALARMPGRAAEALACFDDVLRAMPDYAPAHFHRGNLLATVPGRMAEGIPDYEAVLRQLPDEPEAHLALGRVLTQLGRPADALPHLGAAVRVQPGSAMVHAQLANALALLPGRLDEAIGHDEIALQIDPRRAWMRFNFALHLLEIPGRLKEALAQVQQALLLQPNYLEAENLRGIIHARLGDAAAARAAWTRALELDPTFAPARQNLQLLSGNATR